MQVPPQTIPAQEPFWEFPMLPWVAHPAKRSADARAQKVVWVNHPATTRRGTPNLDLADMRSVSRKPMSGVEKGAEARHPTLWVCV
jgi:hypothetical protein